MKLNVIVMTALAMAGGMVANAGTKVAWEFPLTYSQEGLAFADGLQGILVWGETNVLKVTVGRADLWDHRGGYEWTDKQTYANIKDALQRGDTGRLTGYFDKKVAPGEVRNPYMLPLGHCTFDLGAWQLESGVLDPFTGIGTLKLVDGAKTAEVKLALAKGQFVLEWPKGLAPSGRAICAWNSPAVQRPLKTVGFTAPETWGDATAAGFEWKIPGDPTVSLAFASGKGRTVLTSVRGGRAKPELKGADTLVAASERHWANWWRDAAQVSVPDATIQEIYDYNFYRFGAMTDPAGVSAPLQGPWYEENKLPPWNGDYHFNINIQECYWASYLGNKPQHLMPLFKMVKSWWPRLKDNAKKYCGVEDGFMLPHSVDDRGNCIGGYWSGTIDHGSTAWLAQMMFRYVDVTGDLEFLKSDAYPFMKGAMKVYRAMMEEYHGRLSIAATTSPEWWGMGLPDDGWGRDASFQLAACHNLCRNLVKAAEMLGEKPDPMWLEVEKRLPQYSVARQTSCVRKTNEEIGVFDGFRLPESHRHHSHLAGLVPFDTIDFDADETTKNVVRESFITWVQLGPGLWSGWSMPWAAMIQTRIGMADMAALTLRTWNDVFTNPGHGSRHNGWFPGFSMMKHIFSQNGEGGNEIMQMDGAACVPAAVQEMLCHERQGAVRLFVGAPSKWKDVSFRNFLVGGGFLVSAHRVRGEVVSLKVKASRAGTFRWTVGATGKPKAEYFNAGDEKELATATPLRFSTALTDGVVLQRGTESPVWGRARPGEKVTVSVTDAKGQTLKSETVVAEASGRWLAKTPKLPAGGPYAIAADAGAAGRIVLSDVLFGDVWLCTGQSNMEFGHGWGKAKSGLERFATNDYSHIRLLSAPRLMAGAPRQEFPEQLVWRTLTAKEVNNFSNVGLFFATSLDRYLDGKVPLGLVESNWGGTCVETWVGTEAILASGVGSERNRVAAKAAHEMGLKWEKGGRENYAKECHAFEATFDKYLDVAPEKGPSALGFDISKWKTVKLPVMMEQHIDAGFNGVVYYAKDLELAADETGAAEIFLPPVDDFSDTFVNGVKIGSGAGWNTPLHYTVPAGVLKEGRNRLVVRADDPGLGGGFNALWHKDFRLKTSKRDIALAGEWQYEAFRETGIRPLDYDNLIQPNFFALAYNAMIAPLFPMAVKGAIWYQGCSNAQPAAYYDGEWPEDGIRNYAGMFKALKADWRSHFTRATDSDDEMAFYLVEIAPYGARREKACESDWARICDIQCRLGECEKEKTGPHDVTGTVFIGDVGEQNDIHPRDKETVGRRLARLAANRTYGRKDLVPTGPVPQATLVAADGVTVRFANAGTGLKTRDGAAVAGFELAGADGKFVRVPAKVTAKDAVTLEIPQGMKPTRVRHAWDDCPYINLVNSDAIPTTVFEMSVPWTAI